MNAKNDIILELNRSIECYRVEAKNLRQEIYDNEQELSKKACEIFQLKDRVLLQHSSWQMLESSFKGEIAKLRLELDRVKALRVSYVDDQINEHALAIVEQRGEWSRMKWNAVQLFVAKLFKL